MLLHDTADPGSAIVKLVDDILGPQHADIGSWQARYESNRIVAGRLHQGARLGNGEIDAGYAHIDPIDGIGQGVGGKGELSKTLSATVHQGYAPVIPINVNFKE